MRRSLKWTAAILASGVLHAGAAAWMLHAAPDEVLIEGSATMEIALLGSLEDAISAGEDVEPYIAEPVEDDAEPVDPQPAKPPVAPTRTALAEAVKPAPAAKAAEATPTDSVEPPSAEAVMTEPAGAAPSPTVEAIEPDETLPAQVNLPAEAAEMAEPVEVAVAAVVVPESEPVDVESTAEAVPVEPATPPAETRADELVPVVPGPVLTEVAPEKLQASEQEIAEPPTEPQPAREVETALAVVPPVAEAVEPEEPADMIGAVDEIPLPEDVPLPAARPESPVAREAPVTREAVVRPKVEEPRVRSRPEPRRPSGSGGRQDRDSRKGQADGSERGSAASGGAGRGGGQAGNAAVSNYPGQVASKLRRAVRSVPRGARGGARRDVHVAFVVTANGGLGSVRISQSSGSPELDQAALASVRRAAPFPPIPAGAGRSSWSFSVPLGLAR
jgi:protein TonB